MCEYNLRPEFPTNEMETTEANLEIKVTQLDMAVDKTNTVLHGGKNEAIERHISSLKYISSEINHMRLNLEASKFAAKEEMTAIEEWNARLDAKLEKADSDVAKAKTTHHTQLMKNEAMLNDSCRCSQTNPSC